MTQWIVSSSVLILVIIALRFFLRRRVKPLLQYGIWALVLVRLLLPFQLGSTPISIENAVEKAPLVQEMSYAQQVTHFDYHRTALPPDIIPFLRFWITIRNPEPTTSLCRSCSPTPRLTGSQICAPQSST